MSKWFLTFVILCAFRPAMGIETPARVVSPSAAVSSTPRAEPPVIQINAKLVEQSFRETHFALFIFGLIKSQLAANNFSEAQINGLSAKIYWEIMSEYAAAFADRNLTAKNLNCIISTYALPESVPFKKITAPNANLTEFRETALKNRKWLVPAGAPTKRQVEEAVYITNLGQQILANLTTMLEENKMKRSKETIQPIYDQILMMFQVLLLQNGSSEKSFQKFLNELKKIECLDYFKVHVKYTNSQGLKIITGKIPKKN